EVLGAPKSGRVDSKRRDKSGGGDRPRTAPQARPSRPDEDETDTGEALLAKLSRKERAAAGCDGVIDIIAALFNVSGRELRQPGRSGVSIARVRQVVMYSAHVTLGLTMREVGDCFGRDRTTVLYACHQIEDMRDDEEFDRIVATAERVVRAAFGRSEQG